MFLSQEPRSVWSLFFSSFKAYRQSFVVALPFLSVLLLVSCFPFFLVLLEKMPAYSGAFHRLFAVLTFITLVALPFVLLWIWMVVILRVYARLSRSTPHFISAEKFACEKYSVCLITEILFVIIIFLGFVALIIPGIILTVLLSFQLYCILIDDKDVVGALKESAQLVWGNWWRTFLFTLLVIVVTGLVSTIIGLPYWGLTAQHGKDSQYLAQIINNAVISLFILPWHATAFVLMYHDLKLRREKISP